MKKCALLAVRPVILACILFISGCSKSGIPPSQGEIAALCPISRFSFDLDPGIRDTISFVYNELGNPILGNRVLTGDGSPRYIFRYDRKNRLQDFIGAYNNGAGEFWTRYTYSNDNRTVWDTTFTLVDQIVSWPPVENGFELSDEKEYDGQGRVVKITSFISGATGPLSDTTGMQTFAYDARGNVIGGGSYDDKINYHRTNKVWMFIDNQYSMNNPFPIDAYDIYGLPTRINFTINPNPYPVYYPVLFMLNYAQTVIEYDCGLPKGPAPGE